MTRQTNMKPELEKQRKKFLSKMHKLGISETISIKIYKEVRTQILDSYRTGYSVGKKNGA